ncbi:MAG TPA: hypothetical protein RMG45_26875, partial [Polyangiaceae bacterium LLY-WYZ-15_(1-7)]|nr:hypothetical protein [Polyangiaceae bacterium LLY-WYZ-15_(1-7)]
CPTTIPGAFVEGFETLDALPRCGVPPCETSPSGRVEVVESGSVLAPPAPPLCGRRALRLVRFESPSTAFFAVPVEAGVATYLRAWLWLEEGDGQRVSVLGLTLGDAYRSNDRDGIELSWEPGAAALVTRRAFVEAETPLGAAAPRAGGWRCVELGVEPATGRAWAGADGARVELELDAELAEAFVEAESAHARVGLFETPTAGREGTAFVDEVVVSATPLGCPVVPMP